MLLVSPSLASLFREPSAPGLHAHSQGWDRPFSTVELVAPVAVLFTKTIKITGPLIRLSSSANEEEGEPEDYSTLYKAWDCRGVEHEVDVNEAG